VAAVLRYHRGQLCGHVCTWDRPNKRNLRSFTTHTHHQKASCTRTSTHTSEHAREQPHKPIIF
jgi:hypothetical protein